jgi:hypothetical protein
MTDYTDPTPIATVEQFKAALLAVRDKDAISQQKLVMLRAHCRAPSHTISATSLAQAAGLASSGVANLQYGRFAHAVADQLGYDPTTPGDGSTRWWSTFCIGRDSAHTAKDGDFEWIMRPELVQALQEMKWT